MSEKVLDPKEFERNGENISVYIQKDSDVILEEISKKSCWSKSMVISLMLRKLGPQVISNPGILF